MKHTLFLLLLWGLTACLPANTPLGPEQFGNIAEAPPPLTVEAARATAYLLRGGERQPISATDGAALVEIGQGVAVDDMGRALLHLGDAMTLELLRSAELLQIQHFTRDGGTATAAVSLNGGTLLADLTTAPGIQTGLTVQTAFATIEAANSRFAIVREANSPLEWIVALETGDNGHVSVTAGGVTEPVVGGQARWVTSAQAPGPAIVINETTAAWLENARNAGPQPEIGAILLPPADVLVDAGQLPANPQPGRTAEFGRDVHGPIGLTYDPVGIFGAPAYALEDCDANGTLELAVRNGILRFDFSQKLARVEALDVTLINRGEPGHGLLQGLNPAGAVIAQQRLEGGPGQPQTLSLREDQPLHAATLTLGDACLLGLSLTPPDVTAADQPAAARPVAAPAPQTEVVVNVLADSNQRQAGNGEFQAPAVDTGLISIDGEQGDWETLARQSRVKPGQFTGITYDNGCAKRYPGHETAIDLSGQVQFAYDAQNLVVAFLVNDDGLVTYNGSDNRYFLGDSVQLLLDLDLNGDFNDTALSGDDVQIDILPDAAAPRAVLWQLSSLTARPLPDAKIAVTPTAGGYFIEAALPWASLGLAAPQPGDRLGLVAGINDNDTPNTNNQECIISTSPQRDWKNPTTWGVMQMLPPTTE
jgi:hypothetical protein